MGRALWPDPLRYGMRFSREGAQGKLTGFGGGLVNVPAGYAAKGEFERMMLRKAVMLAVISRNEDGPRLGFGVVDPAAGGRVAVLKRLTSFKEMHYQQQFQSSSGDIAQLPP